MKTCPEGNSCRNISKSQTRMYIFPSASFSCWLASFSQRFRIRTHAMCCCIINYAPKVRFHQRNSPVNSPIRSTRSARKRRISPTGNHHCSLESGNSRCRHGEHAIYCKSCRSFLQPLSEDRHRTSRFRSSSSSPSSSSRRDLKHGS